MSYFQDPTVVTRFFSKVNEHGPAPTDRPELGSCWLWTAKRLRGGYGQFWVKPNLLYAHRVSYTALVGPIPDGLVIDHLCRNRSCVNPNHLEAVTQQINLLRGIGPTGRRARQTHCINGHEFTEANTVRTKLNQRCCLTCRREANYRLTARRQAARQLARSKASATLTYPGAASS